MFNFNGPPRYLQSQLGSAQLHTSSSSNNNNHHNNGTKTRISVSDMGLNTLKHQQQQHHQTNGHTNFQSPSHSQSRNNSVSLPPIKTKSLTAAPTTRLGRPPPDEPKKRPNHREMITLTLKHVQSARGLNFEQLSSFIRGAFELPKSSALDSTLSKTLSNMVSRGYVIQIPGLGPYDACYQLAETPDRGLDLSVRGRSVQEIPSPYPTGYSLPNGKNLVCRTAQKQPDLNLTMEMMGEGQLGFDSRDMNPYRRNPLTTKLDPMPYMPMADPMICQSFGQRNRIVTAGEQRPNSPNLDDQSTTTTLATSSTTTTAMLGYPRDPEFHCNYECHDNYSLEKGLWAPVLPKDDDDDENKGGENSKSKDDTKCDELNENQESNSSSKQNQNPYSNTNQTQVPSLLDTFTESCTLEEFYQSGDEDEDGDEDECNPNFSTEDMKKKKEYSLNFVEGEKKPTDSKNNKITTNTFSSIQSFDNNNNNNSNKLSRLASHRYLQNKMLTTKKSVPSKTSKNGRIQVDDDETDPLENFDVFASYGVETQKEFESNNRSCAIMNDFSQKTSGSDLNLNEDEFENRMDYLYGLADIIDTYKEPLNLRPGTTGITDKTSSKSKTYRK